MSLRSYLANNSYVPLTKQEEAALNRRRLGGDSAARAELITRNLRLARAHAAKFFTAGCDLDDLTSQAILGLIVAVDSFDHRKGKLSIHAGFQIKANLIAFVCANRHIVAVPHGAGGVRMEYLRRLHERGSVDLDQFAREFRTTVPRVLSVIALNDRPASLDAAAADNEGSGFTLREIVPSDAPPPCGMLQEADAKSWVRHAIASLPQREREVLSRRFGLVGDGEATLQDIAQTFGITRERVRQIEAKGLRRLREHRQHALRELVAA